MVVRYPECGVALRVSIDQLPGSSSKPHADRGPLPDASDAIAR